MKITREGKDVWFVVAYGIDGYLDGQILADKLCKWHMKKGIKLKGSISPTDDATGVHLLASSEKEAEVVKKNLEWSFGKKKGNTARDLWKFDNDILQISMRDANQIVINSKDPKAPSLDVCKGGKVLLRHPISAKASNDYKKGWVLFAKTAKTGPVAMLVPESRQEAICRFGKFIGEEATFPLEVQRASVAFSPDGVVSIPKPCPKKSPLNRGYMDRVLGVPKKPVIAKPQDVDL